MNAAILLSHGLVLTVTIACSGKEPAAQSEATTAAAATEAAPAALAPAPAAQPAQAAKPTPIAVADGQTSGLRAEVTELKRATGGTVNLKFTMINESDGTVNVSDVTELVVMDAYGVPGGATIGSVYLIDPVGKKKYFVARDSENKCVCSSFGALAKGARANHWAKFPAPPDDVERISIVIPHFSPMDDVPLSR